MAIKKRFPYKAAFVACNGGCRATADCQYGCVGCELCVNACKFEAIALNDYGVAEVNEDKCIACGACEGAENIVVTAVDPLGVKVGQHVKFEFRDVNIVIGAFICFVMPLLVCAAGAFAGHFLALAQGFDTVQTAVIGGIIGFLIGAVGVKLFDRSLSKAENSKPKIIEICSGGN